MVMRNRQPESLGFSHFIPHFLPWRQDTSCHESSHVPIVPTAPGSARHFSRTGLTLQTFQGRA